MNSPGDNILQHVQKAPMAIALPAMATGILLADTINIPLWGAMLFLVASLATVWLWRHPLPILLFIIATGATSLCLRRSCENIPTHHTEMEIRLKQLIAEDDDSRIFLADIVAYNKNGKSQNSSSSIRAITSLDTACSAGERLVVNASVHRHNPTTDFGEYMSNKGITGYVRITPDNILRRQNDFSLGIWLQEKAKQRINQLNLSPSTKSIATAISIGQRSQIPHTQRSHYTRSGSAHLLAISGLHVGFVFIFISLLLTPLAALGHGTLWRMLLCIIFIWCYAAIAAFSPSVVRAATMFTLFLLTFFFSSRSLAFNSLCATASLMLLWDGRILYDIGFLLSCIAVMAIVEWAAPISRCFKTSDKEKLNRLRYMLQHPIQGRIKQLGRGIGRWIFTGTIVSFVANITTLPLVSLHFGEVSLWGIIVGFTMVALCSVAVITMLTWALIPIPFLAPLVEFIVENSVGAMNAIAEWCASGESLLSFTLQLEKWSCILIYVAFLLLTLIFWSFSQKKS